MNRDESSVITLAYKREIMAYKKQIYIAFDADSDIHYYYLMKAWKQNDNTDFDFKNAHELNTINDSDSEQTKKRKLRERMKNSKIFILLIGEHTKHLYKYVRWEIELAKEKGLPIICINLNKSRKVDEDRVPKIIRETLSVHISFGVKVLQHALDVWENTHSRLIKQGESEPYIFPLETYKAIES